MILIGTYVILLYVDSASLWAGLLYSRKLGMPADHSDAVFERILSYSF
jgi:hypothetical protein